MGNKTLIKFAALIIRDGRFLIVKDADQDFWKNVGGLPENNETPEECLKREVMEELAVKVISSDYYYATPVTMTVTEPKRPLVIKVYKVEIEGEPKPAGETGELHWLSKGEFENGEFNLAMQIKEYIMPKLIKDDLVK